MDRLSREHQRETDDIQTMVDQLQSELDSVTSRAADRIDQLTAQLDQYRTESGRKVEQLVKDVRYVVEKLEWHIFRFLLFVIHLLT